MKRSSKRRSKGEALAIFLVILVIVCSGFLIDDGSNEWIAAYAVVVGITSVVLYVRGWINYEFANSQDLRNSKLLDENAYLIRENNNLRKKNRADSDMLNDEIRVLRKKKSFAERSEKFYRKQFMDAYEILEKLKQTYPELEAVIVAYKAEIEEAQQAAQKASEEIKECISEAD